MLTPSIYYWTRATAIRMYSDLMDQVPFHTGEWQAMKTEGSSAHATHELRDVTIVVPELPTHDMAEAFFLSADDQEWAEEHYQERVSGVPMNPAPSHVRWPYAVKGNAAHTDTQGSFDHTYPERFWPVFANEGQTRDNGRQVFVPHNGVRFQYGDLSDVVKLLAERPGTRQAYLPVWFPEDTWAAANNKRVPCTLGYHFMIRDGRLDMRYFIRSCDAYRHLRNDLYLAGMLAWWVTEQVNSYVYLSRIKDGVDIDPSKYEPVVNLGGMAMTIASLHSFVGNDRDMRRTMRDLGHDDA